METWILIAWLGWSSNIQDADNASIGTAATSVTAEFNTEAACRVAAEKLTKDGYRVTDGRIARK